nr:hypothetical protein CRG98_009532 [Ipomoea batatas]
MGCSRRGQRIPKNRWGCSRGKRRTPNQQEEQRTPKGCWLTRGTENTKGLLGAHKGDREHQRVVGVLGRGMREHQTSEGNREHQRIAWVLASQLCHSISHFISLPKYVPKLHLFKFNRHLYAYMLRSRRLDFPTLMVDPLPFKICWIVFVWVIPPPPQPPKDNSKPLTSLAIEANDLFLLGHGKCWNTNPNTSSPISHGTLKATSFIRIQIVLAIYITDVFDAILLDIFRIILELLLIGWRRCGGGGVGTSFHGIHELEQDPGGAVTVGANATVRGGALNLGTVSFPELLHLVAALHGGLGQINRASDGDIVGDFLPVIGPEITAAEGVPLVPIRID